MFDEIELGTRVLRGADGDRRGDRGAGRRRSRAGIAGARCTAGTTPASRAGAAGRRGGGVRSSVQPLLRPRGMPPSSDAAVGALPRPARVPRGGGDRGERRRAGGDGARAPRRATGVPARTTRRWLRWWRGPFTETRGVRGAAPARLVPAVERRALPDVDARPAHRPARRACRSLSTWLAPLTTTSRPTDRAW